jgi:N-methylhydantoinase A
VRRFLDMRYRGQEYTLPVPITEDLRSLVDFSEIRARFDQLHQEHYGHSAPQEPVMIVNLRLSALGKTDDRLPLASPPLQGERAARGHRAVIFETTSIDTPVYLRSGLKESDSLDGPAVIEEIGATILVYPGDKMQVNEFGHLVIEVRS